MIPSTLDNGIDVENWYWFILILIRNFPTPQIKNCSLQAVPHYEDM